MGGPERRACSSAAGRAEEVARPRIIDSILMVGLTVAIHSIGTLLLLRLLLANRSRVPHLGYVRVTLLLTWVVTALLLLHAIEVIAWSMHYYLTGCFKDLGTCVYFSLITYATVGYGDVVLDPAWRIFGGVEALVGVLTMSWSTALLLGLVNFVYRRILDWWGLTAADLE